MQGVPQDHWYLLSRQEKPRGPPPPPVAEMWSTLEPLVEEWETTLGDQEAMEKGAREVRRLIRKYFEWRPQGVETMENMMGKSYMPEGLSGQAVLEKLLVV